MRTSLPQDDKFPKLRANRLERRQDELRYNYSHVAPLAIADEVPQSHAPRWAWWLKVLATADELLDNADALSERFRGKRAAPIAQRKAAVARLRQEMGDGRLIDRDDEDAPKKEPRRRLRDRVGELLDTPWQKVISDAADRLAVGILDGRASDLRAFDGLLLTVRSSGEVEGVLDDEEFAWLRLAGPNPMVLERSTGLPSSFEG